MIDDHSLKAKCTGAVVGRQSCIEIMANALFLTWLQCITCCIADVTERANLCWIRAWYRLNII